MNRLAAILELRHFTSGGDGLIGAARRVEADLVRRDGGAADLAAADGTILMQAGPGGVRQHGPLTLAGDLGLTDLPALRRALSLGPTADAADLVLGAWLRWAEAAPDHLCGAFCFLIHDRRSRVITAVRDRFGVRPLVYAAEGGRMVIAQDLSTVLAGLDDDPGIDRAWVAEFLASRPMRAEATAFHGVSRLPAGHMLTIAPGAAPAVRAWYRLGCSAPPEVAGDRPAALRAALAHATAEACALTPAAAMLSGGLDSSTLALLSVPKGAQPPVPRPALSLRYDDPDLDEGPFIKAVLDGADCRLKPLSLPGEADASLFDLAPLLDEQDQPVFVPGLIGNRVLYRAARAAGCGGILDGHGGDEIIGGAFSDLAWLVDEGRWADALRRAARYARFTDSSPREAIGLLLAWRGRRGFGRLGRWLAPGGDHDPIAWRRLVDPALAAETRLVERVRQQHEAAAGDPDLPPWVGRHAALLSSPAIAAGFEVLDRSARAAGVVPLYPFYDHRVVELCVWQPGTERIAGGQPRALLRRSMRGVLPESVRLRGDKTNFLSDFWAMLQRDPAGRMAALRTDWGLLEGWVDAATLRGDLDQLGSSGAPDAQTAFRLWRVVWLAAWLQRRAAAPHKTTAMETASLSAPSDLRKAGPAHLHAPVRQPIPPPLSQSAPRSESS